ncbi:hypothetical protein R3I93_006683 [Phoxinus phoxinus]|uniref:Uncharacterized protein n=1 Tax=Phoxinus phoxinus TaxID=58324 RepID=A0AAN9D5X7_9TELE
MTIYNSEMAAVD